MTQHPRRSLLHLLFTLLAPVLIGSVLGAQVCTDKMGGAPGDGLQCSVVTDLDLAAPAMDQYWQDRNSAIENLLLNLIPGLGDKTQASVRSSGVGGRCTCRVPS